MPGRVSRLVWVESGTKPRACVIWATLRSAKPWKLRSKACSEVSRTWPAAMFPLSGLSADTLGQGRIALVGEAAHVMPPIGARG